MCLEWGCGALSKRVVQKLFCGDLGSAYASLAGNHFFIEGTRGRIASMMGATDLAEAHFARAGTLAIEASHQPHGTDEVAKAMMVESFHVRNDLRRDQVTAHDAEMSLIEIIRRIDYETRRLSVQSVIARGIVSLYLGDDTKALDLFRIGMEYGANAICLLGSACVAYNSGILNTFESYVISAEKMTSSCKACSMEIIALIAAIRCVHNKTRIDTIDFGISVPESTRAAFTNLSKAIIDRCEEKKRMVLL